MGGFHLGRPIPLLVNAPDLSRNLLRAAMPCFVPKISGIYMEFETLQRIWQWFSYWGHVSVKIINGGLHPFLFSLFYLIFLFLLFYFLFSIFRTTQVRGYQSCCHISHKLMA